MILADWQIKELAKAGMIDPFVPVKVRSHISTGEGYIPSELSEEGAKKVYREDRVEGVLSYGLSHYGYDIRVADTFKIFTPNPHNTVIDPKAPDERAFYDFTGGVCLIPPNSYALCPSVEHFRLPKNIIVLVVGKSTYARAGIIVNVTPGEPGWEGFWTIEISNSTPLPAKVYANEGIAQCLFFRGEMPDSYYEGKYQNQQGIVLARV